MSKPTLAQRTRPAFRNHAGLRGPDDVHTIPSFCKSNAISESQYFALKRRGLQPREIEIDGRVIISPEAEKDWRREREAETAERRRGAQKALPPPKQRCRGGPATRVVQEGLGSQLLYPKDR
jgi:hypothetical protein